MKKLKPGDPCKHGHVGGRYKDGQCIECCKIKHRKAYDKNPEKYRELSKSYYQDDESRKRRKDRHRKYRGLPEATRPQPVICECCGKAPSNKEANVTKSLALDHDHTTGAFRGWLCHVCNCAIGMLGDSLDGLDRARAYLLRAELL
jgi:hypothetical protein